MNYKKRLPSLIYEYLYIYINIRSTKLEIQERYPFSCMSYIYLWPQVFTKTILKWRACIWWWYETNFWSFHSLILTVTRHGQLHINYVTCLDEFRSGSTSRALPESGVPVVHGPKYVFLSLLDDIWRIVCRWNWQWDIFPILFSN